MESQLIVDTRTVSLHCLWQRAQRQARDQSRLIENSSSSAKLAPRAKQQAHTMQVEAQATGARLASASRRDNNNSNKSCQTSKDTNNSGLATACSRLIPINTTNNKQISSNKDKSSLATKPTTTATTSRSNFVDICLRAKRSAGVATSLAGHCRRRNSYTTAALLGASVLLASLLSIANALDDQHQASDGSQAVAGNPAAPSGPVDRMSSVGPAGQSIVASLSSAVASAAVASAIAAAQSAVSGPANSHQDGRSSPATQQAAATGGSTRSLNSPSHSPAKTLTHLAIRQFADSIPEVPYHILHNMKKLDHAAPFYNVPNKAAASVGRKEQSGPSAVGSLLASAIGSVANTLVSRASGGSQSGAPAHLGGAASEAIVSTLAKSPFWKRLADGYGDFAAEFRSLFKVGSGSPSSPIKATAGAVASSPLTGKLLRDISVPALLMLAASSMPSEVSLPKQFGIVS